MRRTRNLAEKCEVRGPDGRSVTVLVNATPSRLEEDNEVETVVVTLQDMTSLNELEKMRAEFLGSHELRAPLTSIKGSVDTLLESFNSLDSAEMVQFIRIIKSQSDRMRDLISDLLDVARIETGMLSVTPEPVDVGDLVDEAKNTFFTGGGRRNLTIDMELDLPWVMADPAAHRPGLGQPAVKRSPVLPRILCHSGQHLPGGRLRRDVRGRRRPRRVTRRNAVAVPEVLPEHSRRSP